MRAKRVHFTRDRERFIVGRGVLRFILGRYLYIEPNRVKDVLSLYNQRMIFNVLKEGSCPIKQSQISLQNRKCASTPGYRHNVDGLFFDRHVALHDFLHG